MALRKGSKLVAHTRLAVETTDGIVLFVPGEIMQVGNGFDAAQAQTWLDRGSAAHPSDEDTAAWQTVLDERAAAAAEPRAEISDPVDDLTDPAK